MQEPLSRKNLPISFGMLHRYPMSQLRIFKHHNFLVAGGRQRQLNIYFKGIARCTKRAGELFEISLAF
ncbi:MAG: hypothetical protein CML51_11125 [Rhodobacteraceae bacterium]|nr:hypothetical protein [Paracoccaceae bacterium]